LLLRLLDDARNPPDSVRRTWNGAAFKCSSTRPNTCNASSRTAAEEDDAVDEERRKEDAGGKLPLELTVGGIPATPEYLRMSSLVSYELDFVKEYPERGDKLSFNW